MTTALRLSSPPEEAERARVTLEQAGLASYAGRAFVFLVPYRTPPEHDLRRDDVVCSFATNCPDIVVEAREAPGAECTLRCAQLALDNDCDVFVRQMRDEPEEAPTAEVEDVEWVIPHAGNLDWLQHVLSRTSRSAARAAVYVDEPWSRGHEGLAARHAHARFFVNDPVGVGPYVPRQHAAWTSPASILAFQDSDDVPCADRLSRQLAVIAAGADIVGSHELTLDLLAGNVHARRFPLDPHGALPHGFTIPVSMPSMMARAEAVRRALGFSTVRTFANDLQFVLRASFSTTMRNVDEFLFVRRRRPGSLTTSLSTGMDSAIRTTIRECWLSDFRMVWRGEMSLEESSLAVEHRTPRASVVPAPRAAFDPPRPRVSFLMRVQDAAGLVRDSISRVIAQERSDWELLVHDDGSTDGSYEVANAFADPRIVVTRSASTEGRVPTWNGLLARARGKYVVMLDAGDQIEARRLARDVTFLQGHPDYDFVYGYHGVRDGKRFRDVVPKLRGARASSLAPGEISPFPTYVVQPAVTFRRALLERVRGHRERWGPLADEDLVLRAAKGGRGWFVGHRSAVVEARGADRPVHSSALPPPSARHEVRVGPYRVRLETYRPETIAAIARELLVPIQPASENADLSITIVDVPPEGWTWGHMALASNELRRARRGGLVFRGEGAHRTVFFDGEDLSAHSLWRKAVLLPLVELLSARDAYIEHAGLVSQGRRGVMLVGPAGAGKTTLTTAFLRAGYRCFADDRALLQVKGDQVEGWAFPKPLALRAQGLAHFPELREMAVPDLGRDRFVIDPRVAFGPLAFGERASVTHILFPKFSVRGALRVTPLDRADLAELLRVEWSDQTRDPGRLDAVVGSLSRIAAGFAVEYGPDDIREFAARMEPHWR